MKYIFFKNVYAAEGIQSYISDFHSLLDDAVKIIIGLAFLFFLWGLMKFVLSSGNEDKIADGRRVMLWGIIALFVMLSIWGIVALIRSNLGLSGFPAS